MKNKNARSSAPAGTRTTQSQSKIFEQMMENSPLGLWLAKQSMHATEASTYEAALDLETRGVILSQSTSDGREKRMAKEFNRDTVYTNR